MQNILKAFGGLLAQMVFMKLGGDYCHTEALVVITLAMQPVSCSPDVQAVSSPCSPRRATHETLMCLEIAPTD